MSKSELVEHEGHSVPRIENGDGENISIKHYQDIYHQITGRTEKIRQKYSENLLINISDIEQLHHKIMQMCDVHNIIAQNQTVSIFHNRERKEQFTSFERFQTYNSSTTRPTISAVIKYNFSIIPSGIKQPQEYIVTIKLNSRIAAIEKMEEEAPPFLRHRLVSYYSRYTAEISVEYSDYIIARTFMESFDEWIQGCKVSPKKKWVDFLKGYSYLTPQILQLSLAFIFLNFLITSIPDYFNAESSPEIWARFIAIFSVGFYFIITLANNAGSLIEQSIDNITELSYLNLNKGDEQLITKFSGRKRKVIFKFIIGSIITVVLGIVSSKLSMFI